MFEKAIEDKKEQSKPRSKKTPGSKTKQIKKENLHPPAAPKPIEKEIVYDDDYYDNLAKSSEFRRFEYFLRTGKTHRGTLKELKRDLTKFHKNAKIVNEIKKASERGTYSDVVNEFKELLSKHKKKS